MNRITKFTGLLSIDSKSMPSNDLPKIMVVSFTSFENVCGIATPEPMPVVVLSCLSINEWMAFILQDSVMIPIPWSSLTSSSMASVLVAETISGTICFVVRVFARSIIFCGSRIKGSEKQIILKEGEG